LALHREPPRAATARHALVQHVEQIVVARMRDSKAVHHYAIDHFGTGGEIVGPVDIRARARRGDFHAVPARAQALRHLPAILLGTAGHHLAVTLDNEQQVHHTTSSNASSTTASSAAASSSATRSAARAVNASPSGGFAVNSNNASAYIAGPA